jgi:hypothetical protein
MDSTQSFSRGTVVKGSPKIFSFIQSRVKMSCKSRQRNDYCIPKREVTERRRDGVEVVKTTSVVYGILLR